MQEKKPQPDHELPAPTGEHLLEEQPTHQPTREPEPERDEAHDRERFLAGDTPPSDPPGDPFPPHTPPFEEEKGGRSILSPKLLFFLFIFLIIGVVTLAGLLYVQTKRRPLPTGGPLTTTPTAPPSPPEPTPPPTAEPIDVAAYTVQILNGSGIAGEAGRVKKLLEEKGFTTLSIDNADSYSYTNTEVLLKKDIPDAVFSMIQDALDEYTLVRGKTPPPPGESDIQIIVGVRSKKLD